MAIITKEEVKELAQMKGLPCISIFIPTHRAGKDTLEGKDAIMLKDQIKNVKEKLEQQGLSPYETEQFLEPCYELVNNSLFWRHQSDGLALFISTDFFRKYTVPVYFEEFNYVSTEFYLKPLMPLFNEDEQFYLLTLKMDDVRLYEGSKYSITEIKVNDLVPSQIEDRVGYDYEEKSLQFRSQQGNSGEGMYHGHGRQNSDDKNELLRYFRAVNDGLLEVLNDGRTLPLVVACLDFHFPIYKEANTYQNLYPNHISGNPADEDIISLHEKALEILNEHFTSTRKEKKNQFLQLHGTGKASSDMTEVLLSSVNGNGGKVDTLFIENRADIFGVLDPENMKVDIQDFHKPTNTSLLNQAAINVFEQGGKVYLVEKEEMPDSSSKVNALYRY